MATRRSSDVRVESSARSTATRAPARPPKSAPEQPATLPLSAEARRAMIAESAYLRAERRGFAPGHETEDWLAAEVEVDGLLRVGHGGSSQ